MLLFVNFCLKAECKCTHPLHPPAYGPAQLIPYSHCYYTILDTNKYDSGHGVSAHMRQCSCSHNIIPHSKFLLFVLCQCVTVTHAQIATLHISSTVSPMAHEKLKYQISIGLLLAGGQYTKTENIAYMRDSLFELDANMIWLSFCEIIKK